MDVDTVTCSSLDCQNISNQFALINIIPNLSEGIAFCKKCYAERSVYFGWITETYNEICEKVVDPFSDEYDECLVRDLYLNTDSDVTPGKMVDLCTFLERAFVQLMEWLDPNYPGMKHIEHARHLSRIAYIQSDCAG